MAKRAGKGTARRPQKRPKQRGGDRKRARAKRGGAWMTSKEAGDLLSISARWFDQVIRPLIPAGETRERKGGRGVEFHSGAVIRAWAARQAERRAAGRGDEDHKDQAAEEMLREYRRQKTTQVRLANERTIAGLLRAADVRALTAVLVGCLDAKREKILAAGGQTAARDFDEMLTDLVREVENRLPACPEDEAKPARGSEATDVDYTAFDRIREELRREPAAGVGSAGDGAAGGE